MAGRMSRGKGQVDSLSNIVRIIAAKILEDSCFSLSAFFVNSVLNLLKIDFLKRAR